MNVCQTNEAYEFVCAFFDATTGLPRTDLTVTADLVDPTGTTVLTGQATTIVGNTYTYRPAANVINVAQAVWYAKLVPTVTTNVNPPVRLIPVYAGQSWIESIASNAAAVWDYLTTLIVTPGSIGVYILAKLGLITADNVAIAVPVDPDNLALTLYNDTSYLPSSGVSLPTWTNSAWTVYGLTTATVNFYWIDKNSIIDTALGTMVVDSATSIHLTVAHTDVFTLPLGISEMGYKIVAVLDVAHGSEEVQLVNAALSHLNYVQFPSQPNTQP